MLFNEMMILLQKGFSPTGDLLVSLSDLRHSKEIGLVLSSERREEMGETLSSTYFTRML